MEHLHSAFAGSYPSIQKCPAGDLPEYAFIGRSNVGKSSLINMLLDRKNLAHTSKKPGKTQLLNFYLINQAWYLVDLPGYGYAKISKSQRKKWRRMIMDYLVQRPNMQCAFVLIDAMIPPQQKDIDFMNELGELHIPFVIAFTKTDRLKPAQLLANLEAIRAALLEYWQELPQQFVTSAVTGEGREEVLQFIEAVNAEVQA